MQTQTAGPTCTYLQIIVSCPTMEAEAARGHVWWIHLWHLKAELNNILRIKMDQDGM